MRYLCVWLIFCVFVGMAVAAEVPELLEAGNYSEAIRQLESQLKQSRQVEDQALLLSEIAKAQFDYAHDYRAAVRTCQRILKLVSKGLAEEDRLLAQFQMAKAYARMGEYKQAVGVYEQILKQYTAQSLSYQMAQRAIHRIEQGQKRLKAQERWLKEYRGSPLEVEIRLEMAEILLKELNQPEAAIEHYSQIVTAYPENALASDAQWRIANTYHKILHRPKTALDHYQHLLDNYAPSRYSAEALYQIARLHAAVGRLDPAIQAFETLISEYPSFWRLGAAHYWLADAYERKGDELQALEALRTFVRVYLPNMEQAFMGDIGRHGESKLKIEAELAERIHQLETQLPRRLLTHAEAQAKAEDFVGALQSYTKLIALAPQTEHAAKARERLQEIMYRAELQRLYAQQEEAGSIPTLYRIAELHEQHLDEPEKAISLYQRIVDAGDPSWAARAAYRIGVLYAQRPAQKQALLAYQNVISGYPQSPEAVLANFQIAELYRAEHEYEQALAAYRNTISYPVREWYLGEGTSYSLAEMSRFRIGRTLYENLHNYPEALKAFEEFVASYPNSPRLAAAYTMIGLIQEVRGKQPEARRAYEQARDLAFGSEIQAQQVVEEISENEIDFPGNDPLSVGKRLQQKLQTLAP